MRDKRISAERRLVERILLALENEEINESGVKEISTFAKDQLANVENDYQLLEVLKTLGEKWDFLKGIEMLEGSDVKNKEEDEVYQGVLTLMNHGKLDQAIELARSATNN